MDRRAAAVLTRSDPIRWHRSAVADRSTSDSAHKWPVESTDSSYVTRTRRPSPWLPLVLVLQIVLPGCDGPSINITETPIKIQSRTAGRGSPVAKGDTVRVEYVISLPGDRRILDQTDFQFVVGRNAVIRGVDEAVLGMQEGSEVLFICPPHKHWGRAGYANGLIPPATDLTVRMRLLEVVQRAPLKTRASAESEQDDDPTGPNSRWRAVSESMGRQGGKD